MSDVVAPHHCHARNCRIAVPRTMLMCIRHWRMVPKHIQRQVWDNYVEGQCDYSPPPTDKWHEAADAAINAVAELEGY